MKHISHLCALFIFLMACTSTKRTSVVTPHSTDVVQGLDLTNLRDKKLDPVSFGFADSLFDNYRNKFKGKIERNWISMNNNIPKAGRQSKHVWISYEEFSAFVNSLENIKNEIKRNNNLDVSGVRIYFAAYPRDEDDEQFRKKLTVILCGTYEKNTPKGVKHVDIVGRTKANKEELAAYHNHGHLCPPDNCEGALLDER